MIRRPPRSTLSSSSAASDVYKRQVYIKFNSLYASPALNYENQSFPVAVVTAAFLNLPAVVCAGYGFFAIRTKVLHFSKYGELSYILTCTGLVTMTYIAGRAYH